MSKETAREAAAWLWAIRRRRYSIRQLWQVPTFLLGLLAVAAVCAARPLWYDGGLRQLDRELGSLRAQLSRPDADLKPLLVRAESLRQQAEAFPQRAGEAEFLLAAVLVRLADQGGQEPCWQKARQHLQRAEQLGVPPDDQPRLAYLLGKSGYHLNLDPAAVIACLTDSIEAGGQPAEGYGMLAEAYLRLPTPNLRAALEANHRQLATAEMDDAQAARPRLLRAELLLQLEEVDAARTVLKHLIERTGPGTPSAIRYRARVLLAQSYQDQGNWNDALAAWEELLSSAQTAGERGRALYYLGLCQRKQNRPEEAVKSWEAARLLGGDEGQAAALALAQLYLQQKSDQPAAVVEAFHTVIKGIKTPADYRNSLVDLAAARSIFESGCQALREAGHFEEAQRLARYYERLALPGKGQEAFALAAEAWAQQLLREARSATGDGQDPEKVEAARSQWRKAGAAYEAAARESADPVQKADWLWRSADRYSQGQDPGRALNALEHFVGLDKVSPERLGEAWFHIGRLHQEMKHDMSAGAAFRRCIEYASPFAFRARYHLALAQIERQDLDEAEAHLLQNLQLMQSAPDPEAHEKTLYALANLLFRRGNYAQAARRLQEALERYPANAEALKARFQLARACRFLADQETRQLSLSEPATPEARTHYQRQARKWLELAAINFLKIADDLAARAQSTRLNADEETTYRQASFGVADCRFAQGQFDEALRLYEILAGRYHHQVDGLIALWHVWRCWWVKSEPDRARQTHGRIAAMVKEMDAAAFDGSSEVRTRHWWEKWLSANQP